ncbi:MAG: hypothetical protein ABFQ65_04395 [Nanoarchaeota archaeon]
MKQQIYRWTIKDKWIYVLAITPFLIAFIGASYLIGTISIYLTLIFFSLYIISNIFQAGACTGCPYRGKYCPPLFGVYLGNILSTIIYKNKKYDLKFIKLHGKIAEIIIYLTFLFPIYWLFSLNWYFVVIYFSLLLTHLILFMPTQCEKCSYNEICPGGIAWKKCKKIKKSKQISNF